MSEQNQRIGNNYDRAAWFYELSAAVFSVGKIRASKKYAVSQLTAGDHVLILGVGTGEDALMAAHRGVQVTCIDLSHKMLDQLSRKLKSRNLSAEVICGNAFDHQRPAFYDAVCAPYFLNIFLRPDMERMLVHAASLLKPDGKFLIADVAQAQGNFFARAFNIIYLKLAMVCFWLLGLVPLHRNYDYRDVFPVAGLQLDHIRYFRFLKIGPVLFQTMVARTLPINTKETRS